MDYENLPRDEAGEIKTDDVIFPVKYTLLSPFVANGSTIENIELQEPTVKDIQLADSEKDDLARISRLVSQVTGLTPDEVKTMKSRDWAKVRDLVADFLL